ncbi:hypothetical protein SMICM304S_11809 [Streptomyces microflavus]
MTTRPSAVPESWLSGSGFAPHTLLAMSQEDVRSFLGHWHRAARSECRSDEERAELDTYETRCAARSGPDGTWGCWRRTR